MASAPRAAIAVYWSWWAMARSRFERALNNASTGTPPAPELAEEMTRQVKSIAPGLAWEFGPGRQKSRYYLCVTGEGDAELRPVAERWVRAAPPADAAWEYYPARPPTPEEALEGVLQLPGRFRAQRLRLAEARLDVRIDEDRQLIDVGVYHPMLRKLPEQTRATPAFLLLGWLLGEDGMERWVGRVDVRSTEPAGTVAAEALPEVVRALAERHPNPTWAVLQGRDNSGQPLLVVARRPLKRIDWPLFDLHGRLTVAGTMAPPAEVPEAFTWLAEAEDDLQALLGEHAVLVARETRPDRRSLHLYCDSEGPAPGQVDSWRRTQPHPLNVAWQQDPAWTAVQPFQ
jgi:hypothetical protein